MTDTMTVRGFAGTDPEFKAANTGNNVATFRLGSTPRWRNPQTGDWVSGETNWFTVACFGRLAENVTESVHKGEPVVVTGRPRMRPWTDSEGRQRWDFEINAQVVAHDLSYGQSSFEKVSPSTSAPAQETVEGSAEDSADEQQQQRPADPWDGEPEISRPQAA